MSTNSVMTQATHVLIVDDDPDIRETLSDMLEHEGYRVHAVGTGVEAIRQARQTHYGAALLDMQLPDLHGHIVMKFLMDADPKLPIIAITAYALEENTIGSLTRGAFAYVTKPYNSTELKATLRKAIGVKALAVKAETAESALSESEDRYRRQNAALIALARAEALQSADFRSALRRICEVDAGTLGVDRVSFWRLNEDRTAVRCVELYELSANRHSSGQELIAEKYPAYFRALPQFEVLATDDAHRDPRTSEFSDSYLTPLGITSMMDVPVSLNGVLVGVLCHEHVGPARQWMPDEQAFALAMASLVALTLGQWERRRAEDALRESEERFRQVAENIREVFWMTDPEKTRIIYISPGYEQIWGRTCQSLYTEPRSWLDAIHPDDRTRVREAALTRQASGDYDEEYRVVRPDGSTRWIHDQAFPVRDESGKTYRVTGIAEDITERKQAQAALRTAYDRMEEILASLPGAILIVNQDRQVAYANPLAEEHFGAPGARLVGSLVYDVLPLTEPRWNLLMTEFKTFTGEAGTRQPDGEFEAQKRVYQYRLFPVKIREREPQQTGIVIWDITEQKQLQDQLIQAEKLASLGTLVSGMAHEINNPVQGILGMAEIIAEEEDQANIKEYAADIVGYAKHVATIVGGFVSYARPASRNGEVEMDLSERLLEAVKMVRLNPQFGAVEVVTQFQPVPRFRGRQSEIDQVFVNLIYNAVQAMEGMGRLTLATRHLDGVMSIMISDTGCGIPKSLLNRIFDPFFTTKDPGKGTGLGLSIVYTIVSRYQGAIRVESEEGKGTTFTIQFPAGSH
ncbi:MAG: PAS domain S-box protein [Nitrospiraceae bacterium]